MERRSYYYVRFSINVGILRGDLENSFNQLQHYFSHKWCVFFDFGVVLRCC